MGTTINRVNVKEIKSINYKARKVMKTVFAVLLALFVMNVCYAYGPNKRFAEDSREFIRINKITIPQIKDLIKNGSVYVDGEEFLVHTNNIRFATHGQRKSHPINLGAQLDIRDNDNTIDRNTYSDISLCVIGFYELYGMRVYIHTASGYQVNFEVFPASQEYIEHGTKRLSMANFKRIYDLRSKYERTMFSVDNIRKALLHEGPNPDVMLDTYGDKWNLVHVPKLDQTFLSKSFTVIGIESNLKFDRFDSSALTDLYANMTNKCYEGRIYCLAVENNPSDKLKDPRRICVIHVLRYPDPNEYYEGHGREKMSENAKSLKKLKGEI